MSLSNEQILDAIAGMTLLEVMELVKAAEEKFGVTAAAPVMVAAAGPAAAVVEEKTEFTVVLADAGANKVNAIQAVRAITDLGLKEAKDLVEADKPTVVEGVSKEAAADAKAKLEAEGAKVDIK